MSLNEPASTAARVASHQGTMPSTAKQLIILVVGIVLAVAVALCLTAITATEPPLWAIAAIPFGIVLWLCVLAVQSWSIKSVFGATRSDAGRVVVRPGYFLAAICRPVASRSGRARRIAPTSRCSPSSSRLRSR